MASVKAPHAGQFKKGQRANPAGRPKGIVDKRLYIRKIFHEHQEEFILKAIELAKAGDRRILAIILDKILPPGPKDDYLPEEVCQLNGRASEQAAKIIEMIFERKITPMQGNTLLDGVHKKGSIVQMDEIVERLEALEEKIDKD